MLLDQSTLRTFQIPQRPRVSMKPRTAVLFFRSITFVSFPIYGLISSFVPTLTILSLFIGTKKKLTL